MSANGIILIALETIWEPKKEVFLLTVSGESSHSPSCLASTRHTGLKGAVLPELFAESDINWDQEDGGSLSGYPKLNVTHLSQASGQCRNQTWRQPSFGFLAVNVVNNSTVANHQKTGKQ